MPQHDLGGPLGGAGHADPSSPTPCPLAPESPTPLAVLRQGSPSPTLWLTLPLAWRQRGPPSSTSPRAPSPTPPATAWLCAPSTSHPGLPLSGPHPEHTPNSAPPERTHVGGSALSSARSMGLTLRRHCPSAYEGSGPAEPSCHPDGKRTCAPRSPATHQSIYCVDGTSHKDPEVLHLDCVISHKTETPLQPPRSAQGTCLLSEADVLALPVLRGWSGGGWEPARAVLGAPSVALPHETLESPPPL